MRRSHEYNGEEKEKKGQIRSGIEENCDCEQRNVILGLREPLLEEMVVGTQNFLSLTNLKKNLKVK